MRLRKYALTFYSLSRFENLVDRKKKKESDSIMKCLREREKEKNCDRETERQRDRETKEQRDREIKIWFLIY